MHGWKVNLLSYTPQNWRLMLSIYLMSHAEIADDLPKKILYFV